MKVIQLPRPQPDPEVIADLRELLAQAESGEVAYIAYVSIDESGSALQWEVGSRDPHRVAGLLHELAAQVLEADEDDTD